MKNKSFYKINSVFLLIILVICQFPSLFINSSFNKSNDVLAVDSNFYATFDTNDKCLTFVSDKSFNIGFKNIKNGVNIEYSLDGTNWTQYSTAGVNIEATNSDNTSYKVYFRGSGNNSLGTTASSSSTQFQMQGESTVSCLGNVMTLLDYNNSVQMDENAFRCLILDCNILDKAPLLNATILSNACYYSMFENCSSLKDVSDLPATILTNECYRNMFRGCSSIVNPPAIKATQMGEFSCILMFGDCSSLKTAPELNSTNIATYCYNGMFLGCTSLTQAPVLPATTLYPNCYRSMFSGCTGLTQAPVLPATVMQENCYYKMFYECTNITNPPVLNSTSLAVGCYQKMFEGCTNLKQMPNLPATDLPANCYSTMFKGCSLIKLSDTLTKDYLIDWQLPSGATGSGYGTDMFSGSGGTFQGEPELNKTYYLYTTFNILKDSMYVSSSKSNTVNPSVNNTMSIAYETSLTDKLKKDLTWVSSSDDNINVEFNTSTFEAKATGKKCGTVKITAKYKNIELDSINVQSLYYDVTPNADSDTFKAVYWATQDSNPVINDNEKGVSFAPSVSCSRAQFATYLWKTANKPNVEGTDTLFPDVSYSAETDEYKAIKWCKDNNIVKGYLEGETSYFKPENTIKRTEAMIMIYRYAKKLNPSIDEEQFPMSFIDAAGYAPSTDTYKSISWGASLGITKGYSNGTFGVKKACIKSAAAILLYRMKMKLNTN